ncbi:restriction endonuclease subunit S [Lactiplantibacillus plantarum]|nr:restriction endonuclease subunit S [Lactiplantibacillus plantarum]
MAKIDDSVKKKVPELRFKGFTDEWEERKFFESIASTIDFRGRTPKKLGMDWSESGYLALSALNVKNGYIDPLADAHYGDENLYKKWMSGKELKKGQVLFTTEAPMGNVAQVPDNNGYILSQRTVAFETKEDMMTNDFLAVLLKSPLVFNNLSALSSGGTAKGVSQKSLKGLSITVPFDIDEQQKIGSFFKQLDDTIALHQRKLAKLKELKQGYLQKMFPQNGSKFPQLRFAGFADDWGLRKLGEVYNFQYGQFNNNPDNGGQYPIYGANGIIGGYDEYNSENAIVIGHMGAYAGHVLWAEGKHFVTYNGTMGIADKSILNSNFGYYLVVSVNVPKLTAGSGQPFVSYSDLNGIKILIPTIEEQQKIGSFFKQLDNTIALHQRKLDLLKEQKKGFLQNMFV